MTDHDTLAGLPEEGWYGAALMLVGEEVSPRGRDHTLAFGVERPVRHRGRSAAEICADVASAGGITFAAHPFSRGSDAFPRFGQGTPYTDLDVPELTGIELWSFVTDTAESLGGIADVVRFVAGPGRFVEQPPARNLHAWDRLCERRRLVAIGGIDAHQIGLKVGGHVPLRLMGYARSFRQLRTHVLCETPPTGDASRDRDEIYAALRAGRCYIARDSLAPARGFAFWAESGRGETLLMGDESHTGEWTLHVRLPRPAQVRVVAGGRELAAGHAAELDLPVESAGAHRVEVVLSPSGRAQTWILSNPIYLR